MTDALGTRLAATQEDDGPQAPLLGTLAIARPAFGRLGIATLLGACAAAAAICLIATSAWLISRSAQRPQESAVAIAIVGVQFFALARGLCRYAERLVGHDAAFRVLADTRVAIYRRLERLAPLGVPVFRSGDLLARLVHDVDALQDVLLRVLPPFAIALAVGAATVAGVFLMLPAAGLILLAALALAGTLVPWLTARLAARDELRQAGARAELTATVVDLIEGAPELLVNGAAAQQVQRALAADAALTSIAHKRARTAGVGQGLTTLCCGLAMWGGLAVGVSAVRAGEMHGVLLAGIALIPLVAFELVVALPAATQTLERVRRSAARVQEVIDAPEPVSEPALPLALPAPPYSLQARGVRARYPHAAQDALEGIDLDLRPGRRVAVVGPSGAGKSTLAGVLLRLLDYDAGSIALDGAELSALAGDDCRTVIGLVAQDTHIFDSPLEENLRLARRDADGDELRAALAAVRLLDWADALPDGLGTAVGERGMRLSGGQRQRIAIARALLADFPMLILDEPGEHLDTATGDAILAELAAAAAARATMLITHRLAALEDFHEVLLIAHGRVLERGTHSQLLERGGRYAELWEQEAAIPG